MNATAEFLEISSFKCSFDQLWVVLASNIANFDFLKSQRVQFKAYLGTIEAFKSMGCLDEIQKPFNHKWDSND